MDTMWQEYGIEELEKGMQKLFPTFRISVTDLMTQILQGDILWKYLINTRSPI